jgi:deoxyribodipyrimidine photo-lyase
VEECDAHNVVPCWEASDKLEVGARTLRGRLAKRYGEFLNEFPDIPGGGVLKPYDGPVKFDAIKWDAIIQEALERGAAVPEVTWAIPGERAAAAVLEDFVHVRMKMYESRNDPVKPQALSGLSPWLHFGQISGQRCALDAKKACGKASPKAYETFFEELVVRRELSDNFCYYSPKYDSIEGQKYDWAKDTLRAHAGDKRPYVYTLEEFERAKTHDDLWNAAQRELRYGGKMHGFLRMYWAKKILEWTESPEQALEFAIYLNDTYSLDGRDPSGYVGCMWSIVGVHDQGWKEREVFGKIRYMTYDGCSKKFRIPDYIARVNALVKAAKADFKSGERSSAANPGLFKIADTSTSHKRKATEDAS